ncbi:hypothetical protein SAMN05421770_103268 [Granulicella rosea]|uniref:Dolichyl-phosphate-mannose-protein mannosyltransferase n=1 Tax=Granulicella rosea TaxID=474952 RepID=A0A239ITA5_9BACT|nr:hypothetical protein [Granulicella rosea]SNS96799.1 hypothetical protein SAMN05421770_103268 [Granulicella rosea]
MTDHSAAGRPLSSSTLLLLAALTILLGSMFGQYDLDLPTAGRLLVAAAVAIGIAAAIVSLREVERPSIALPVRGSWRILAGLALFHIVLAVYCIHSVSPETIDCITFQRDAVRNLLHGVDPYGQTQANIYSPELTKKFYGPGMVVDGRVQVGFQYPPLTLAWALPGYLLGDVRYSYVLAIVAAALLLYGIYPGGRSLGLAAFLLLNPLTYYVEDRGWTEPLVLMLAAAALYAAVHKRWWLPLAAGLLLGSKQYNFLALPFLGYLAPPLGWRTYRKLAGYAMLVGLATALPFLLWNAKALVHDIVLFHLAQPFRDDALSMAVPFPWMLKVGPLFVIAFVLWYIRKGPHRFATFAAGYALAMLIFVATSKQAFCNYFFLIGNLLLLAVAAMPSISLRPQLRSKDVV